MRSLKLFVCIVCAVAITFVCSIAGGADNAVSGNYSVRVALASPELGSGLYNATFSSDGTFTVTLQNGRGYKCSSAHLSCKEGKISITLYDSSQKLIGNHSSPSIMLSGEKCALEGIVYDGDFEVSTVGKQLKIINILPLEDYVKGVMPYEVGIYQHDEITKAFSILVRTVGVHHKHAEYGFDVCATSCCQNYKGYKIYDERLRDIVDSTKGLILTYEGEPISCTYCNSNGGASCPASDAWGGSGVPYLTSVELDEGEYAFNWQKEITLGELSSRAAKYGAEGDITNISLEYSDSGFVVKAVLTDSSGKNTVIEDTSKVRKFFGLNSARFEIEYYITGDIMTADGNKNSSDSILTSDGIRSVSAAEFFESADASGINAEVIAIFNGSGHGHCVGFSLAGAKMLVKKGYKYKDIATFYFKGAVISEIK